jgi:hypothetical protein
VSTFGTTDIELGPRFSARVSASGTNLGSISIHVVPEVDMLAVNLGPISISVVVSFWDYGY